MPTQTYFPLANITLGSSASSVSFSSIPASFRDLVFVYNGNTSGAGFFDLQLKLNDGASHNTISIYGNGSSASTFTQSSFNLASYGDGRVVMVANIFDYAQTDKHKTALLRGNAPATGVAAHALRYASTSAVNTVVFAVGAGSFVSGSTFALYGIAS